MVHFELKKAELDSARKMIFPVRIHEYTWINMSK